MGNIEKMLIENKIKSKSNEMFELLKQVISLKPLIEYPEDTKQEHLDEAIAIGNLINKIESLIKEATTL